MAEHPETVDAFMKRMWNQDMKTISEEDYSTLIAIAMMGAQHMIVLGGPDVAVPGPDSIGDIK